MELSERDLLKLYGAVPDRQIAAIIGKTTQSVSYARRKAGYTAYCPKQRVDWTIYDKILGTMTDTAAARIIGCDRSTVSSRRYKLRIGRCPLIDWEKYKHVLLSQDDATAARIIGCHPSTIHRFRLFGGMAAWQSTK